jgi:hypothetical protein
MNAQGTVAMTLGRKEWRWLPCICATHACMFARYDHLEYAKAQRVGLYKYCIDCRSWLRGCKQGIEGYLL